MLIVNLFLISLLSSSVQFQENQNISDLHLLQDPPFSPNPIEYSIMLESLSKSLPRFILSGFIPDTDKRFPGLVIALSLLAKRRAKILIETGTLQDPNTECKERGCPTLVFGHFAKMTGAKLYSIDIYDYCRASRIETQELGDSIEVIWMKSIDYLNAFNKGLIDFLYLNSYEFNQSDPLPGQKYFLQEIIAAYPKMHKGTVIMIDDCKRTYNAKCKLVDEFLIEHGWKLRSSGFQRIYVFPE